MQYLWNKNVRLERDWSMSIEEAFPGAQIVGAIFREMWVGKRAREFGREHSSIFPDPLLPRRSTTGLQLSADRDY